MSRFRNVMPELDSDVVNSSNVTPLPRPPALQWEVFPEDGRPSWDVDIRPYAFGDPEKGISAREQLAAQLAPAIRAHSYGRTQISEGRFQAPLESFGASWTRLKK